MHRTSEGITAPTGQRRESPGRGRRTPSAAEYCGLSRQWERERTHFTLGSQGQRAGADSSLARFLSSSLGLMLLRPQVQRPPRRTSVLWQSSKAFLVQSKPPPVASEPLWLPHPTPSIISRPRVTNSDKHPLTHKPGTSYSSSHKTHCHASKSRQ